MTLKKKSRGKLSESDKVLATAILGVDTLWGGDVMNPSGMGRFIADSWFADVPLPAAYKHPAAARLRDIGGISAKTPDPAAVNAYLAAVDVPEAIQTVTEDARRSKGLRGEYMEGLAESLKVMWDLAMEVCGKGEPVPYTRCMKAATGLAPEESRPEKKRRQVADLLGIRKDEDLAPAVASWRRERLVPSRSLRALSDAFIAQIDALTVENVLPFFPPAIRKVPRANIRFLPIENAWFSGSMNYLGRARNRDGSPQYEATYEINAALEISIPEFVHLISHEVVPGHVTTLAYLQNLYVRGRLGFEATVQTMNSRAGTLAEGIANNAILMAYGVTEVEDLPDRDLQIGTLLSLLQDDAKNQSSYLTWQAKLPQTEVKAIIRRDYLLSEERAEKLSGAWGRHPLMGRMNLPAYRAGTDLVASLRRRHPPEKILPALFGCQGIVDCVNISSAL